MKNEYKKTLEEVLTNLRCIDTTGNIQVESYIDDSIRIIKDALEKETAQEVRVQEQYEGKCEHCGHDNDFKLSIGVHLPNGVFPKFCMKCGNKVNYVKKDNLHQSQDEEQ